MRIFRRRNSAHDDDNDDPNERNDADDVPFTLKNMPTSTEDVTITSIMPIMKPSNNNNNNNAPTTTSTGQQESTNIRTFRSTGSTTGKNSSSSIRTSRRQSRNNDNERSMNGYNNNCCTNSTCWQSFWKCSRQYICTSGWYPLFVAIITTSSFMCSLYSTSGCQFIDMDIGFVPSNLNLLGWEDNTTTVSTAQLGLFYYYNKTASSADTSNDIFYNGCIWYNDVFETNVIDRDRTWRVSRVMSLIAVSSSLFVTLTIWMLVVTPIPIQCIWPTLLLPNTMLSFITEGSKFLLFDIALCQKEIWYPSGIDSLPEIAEQCTLSTSSYYGIAAGVLHLVALICICWYTPTKRKLDPSYGIYPNISPSQYNSNNNNVSNNDNGAIDRSFSNNVFRFNNNESRKNRNNAASVLTHDPSLLDEDIYTEGPSPANRSIIIKSSKDHEYYNNDAANHHHYNNNNNIETTSQEDDSSSNNENSTMQSSSLPLPVTTSSFTSFPKISESRIAVLSKFDLSNNKNKKKTSSITQNNNTNNSNNKTVTTSTSGSSRTSWGVHNKQNTSTTSSTDNHDCYYDNTVDEEDDTMNQSQQRMIEDLLSEIDTSLGKTKTTMDYKNNNNKKNYYENNTDRV